MPTLSIIVTAYNVAPYIGACLDSVRNQTLEDIEIVVVDDGSTDGTAEIIAEQARADARIRPIRFGANTPGGVGCAANAGLAAATGDYLGFADGDDLYDARMFATLHAAAVAHDADLAMCRYRLLDEASGELREPDEASFWLPYREVTAVPLDAERRSELLRFIAVPWRKLYRRDLVERTGLRFPEGDFFFEDNPVHWAAILGAKRAVLVPERLCRHRVGRPGQTMDTADRRLPQIFCHHDIIRDLLQQAGAEEAHRRDLLLWTATQLAWVSARADDEVRRALYDILVPILAQYPAGEIRAFCAEAAPFGTAPMLLALRDADFAAFDRAAGAMKARARRRAEAPARSGGTSLLAVGLYHLRHSGLRRTARLTLRYAAGRLKGGAEPGQGEGETMVSRKDVMMALVVLQREVRGLREEVAQLRAELARREAADGDNAAGEQKADRE